MAMIKQRTLAVAMIPIHRAVSVHERTQTERCDPSKQVLRHTVKNICPAAWKFYVITAAGQADNWHAKKANLPVQSRSLIVFQHQINFFLNVVKFGGCTCASKKNPLALSQKMVVKCKNWVPVWSPDIPFFLTATRLLYNYLHQYFTLFIWKWVFNNTECDKAAPLCVEII